MTLNEKRHELLVKKMKLDKFFSLYLEKFDRKNYLEPEDVSKLINKSLKDKIEMNFRELNYLPKQAQLDV